MTDFDSDSPQTDLFAGNSELTGFIQEHLADQDHRADNGRDVAAVDPIARIILDSDVPHLDRTFDYLVPAEMNETARQGTRVRVRFGEQKMSGFIRSRNPSTGFTGSLKFLDQVVSPVPVVTEELFELAELVAARCASTVANVLRLAVAPRIAGVEKKFIDREPQDAEEQLPEPTLEDFASYEGAEDFLADIAEGDAARAVIAVTPGMEKGWENLVATALIHTARAGRGALAVVPDYKDLQRLHECLSQHVGDGGFAVLSAHQKPAERYRAYLQALHGDVSIVIGTRSAAYAPVRRLGLVVCWDDGDPNLMEPRAPYCHARDVLLLRAEQTQCAALFAGYSISAEGARLIRSRWATYLSVPREFLRTHTPHVISTGDDYQLARDPLAAVARFPHLAFIEARKALSHGPVLIQVSRSGYIPNFSCQRCRMPARCTECQGPLGLSGSEKLPTCRWCGAVARNWNCIECGGTQWRHAAVGALRTAEELGRAFPNVPVFSSSGDHIMTEIEPGSAIVVATPGAEPAVTGGYAAAILLDADAMLRRDSLRAPEMALRNWLNAAALVRPRSQGGTVVTTAPAGTATQALIRWDPVRFAVWELDERAELGLPPAVRTAAITGQESAVEDFVNQLDLPPEVTVRGPVDLEPMGQDEPQWRTILFFNYSIAPEVTRQVRAVRASRAALKLDPVNIRVDGLDIL